MKKILLLLLLMPMFIIGQVSTGQEQEFDYGIKNNSPQTVTTSSFITTTGTDGTQGKILGENISLSVIPPVTHFTPVTPNIKGYFQGVDDAIGNISATHNPLTLGTANGLSLATQVLSLGLASSGVTGALSGTDWNTFNNKFNTPTGLTANYIPKWNGSGFVNSGVLESVLGTLEVDKVVKKTSTERNYIFEGDSRMATDTYNETAISEFLADASNFKNTGNISNFAVGGSSIAGMQARYTSNIYPLKPNGTTVKEAYLFILIGINDLTVASPDAVAIYNSLSSYATTAKADGFKVVVFTTFYRQDFTILQEKARIDFNEYIKSNSNLFYAIIDTDAMLSPSKSDLFYYDVVHLRSTGNKLIADFVNKTFNSAFNAGNSYDRSFLQDTFTPRSNTLNIDSGGTFPLKISTTANEAYINLRNSTSSSLYGGLIRSFGDNIGFYHGNSVKNSLVLNSDGTAEFGGTITSSPAITANQVVIKSQLDAFVPSGTVNLTGAQTVLGVKTFSSSPIVPTAVNANEAVNKGQLDAVAAIPYKVYTALISQSGTGAPTATVLKNTLGGTVVWTRAATGQYIGTLSGAFPSGKTVPLVGRPTFGANTSIGLIRNASDNQIAMDSYLSGVLADGQITNIAVKIEVYP